MDHHVAHVGERLADERDAHRAPLGDAEEPARHAVDPLGAGAGLAGAAPAEHEPGVPGGGLVGRNLMVAGPAK